MEMPYEVQIMAQVYISWTGWVSLSILGGWN